MSFLDRAPWPGYDAPGLRPSGFCARRKMLRSRPRLKPSLFLVRQGMLASEGQRLNYDGSLKSLVSLYETHPLSPLHRLTAATRRVYVPYDVHQSRDIPARAPRATSTHVSRTANVIRSFLEGGPRSRREVEHHVLLRSYEESSFQDALALLGAVEIAQMQLPARGLVTMLALPGQLVARTARADVPVTPRGQRRPRHLSDRRI
jgi:hypothetical protein